MVCQEISQWMFTHIAVVRDLVDTQYKEYQEVSVAKVVAVCRASL